jgi:hypothetical protein
VLLAILAVFAALGLLTSVLLATRLAAVRARRRRTIDRLRDTLEPYLRRKAAEAGLSQPGPTITAKLDPDDVIGDACNLAERLLAHDKGEPQKPTTYDFAVADTEQIDAQIVAHAGRITAPERPGQKKPDQKKPEKS